MRIIEVVKTANQNLLRNKGRSFLTILAVFIGSFTIIMTTGINTGVNSYIDRQLESAGGENILEISASSTSDMSSMMGGSGEPKKYEENKKETSISEVVISGEQLDKVRKIENIESASPFVTTRMSSMMMGVSIEYAVGKNGEKYQFDVRSAIDGVNIDRKAGEVLDNQADENQVAIDMDYVTALGYDNDEDALGSEITLYVPDQVTKELVPVKATIRAVLNKSVLMMMSAGVANSHLVSDIVATSEQHLPSAMRGLNTMAMAQMKPGLNEDEIKEIKNKLKDIGLSGMTVSEEVGMMKTFFDAITTVLTIFGGIALIAASIGIINTLYMAVQERTREIGLMKAMGLGKGKIRLMFSLEAVALGFWGATLGIAVAYVTKYVANGLAEQTFLKDLPGFVLIEFNPITLIYVALIIMLIAFLAGTLPARKASKLDPIESLRYE